jgi:hypothetical protein
VTTQHAYEQSKSNIFIPFARVVIFSLAEANELMKYHITDGITVWGVKSEKNGYHHLKQLPNLLEAEKFFGT